MKEIHARDIMVQDYGKIRPEASVREAVRMIFQGKVRESGYKPFGILVIDEIDRLVGMVSMHDILYHLRPPYLNYAFDSFHVWEEDIDQHLAQFNDLKVEQIMSAPVITVTPEVPLMTLVDLMVKKRARRLPVLEGEKVLGVVYLSDVFFHLCKSWLDASDML
ncbi:MAG: CBS domain-containing protein [Deltaproteobacteria bacterium]|nr:CBS domain-containing protein [Deltaproteobacteria bacterium]MBW2017580.1 CBS domain-containing protein [Deltaproteobacteria bacterium]MBW2130435.1 CBS domain-containing protein [Deltaproteobacteria bacterium]MBW2303819.1 CBS domain-containing protein [Deltaproteobacteria bacterium]